MIKKNEFSYIEKKKFKGNILIIGIGVFAILIAGLIYSSSLKSSDLPSKPLYYQTSMQK